LRLIQETGVPLSASIIDISGGAFTLVDDLLQSGYSALTVLDISEAALATAQKRLGLASKSVKWIEANITDALLPIHIHAYDVWHDRAVFHSLISPQEHHAYIKAVTCAVKPGGHVIVATFAEDGPTQCSGLPVMRYSANELDAEFGSPFTLLRHEKEEHRTPFGTVQNFIYCYFRKGVL
jgi:2-polyprenyl-3-methyl-5-hydroxy-6-metoxy-1,4-benzoquinol methylase